ncbi:MAG: SAM-dependent chlorinase/fluorinase [Acidobacteriia bacterium]|nr:SAM-dependent chlorinase/fluorinase [Terriglobia bacterium]
MPAILTLTTDFGLEDHFVGVMKGVILRIAPATRIVDISHQIKPFAVHEAAFVIAEAYRWFPKKTVHVVVVDPGVGSARRPILVEAAGQYFLGPDNGVFGMLYSRNLHTVRHVTNKRFFLHSLSQTFQGRDLFAPAAAHLAKGVRPAQMGKRVDDYLRPRIEHPTRTGTRCWSGTILKVDRFGNLITNFHIEEFPAVLTRPFVMMPGVRTIEKLMTSYADAPAGEPVVIAGSSGYFEVAVNQGSAAEMLGCGPGSPVELSIY